ARTQEQLRQRARDLLDFVQAQADTIDMAALAYTLQVGREAMEERLALVVRSGEELVERLRAYISGAQETEGTYQGQVRRNESISLFNTDLDLQETTDKWLAGKKLTKLLELWVKGLEIDWSKLYGETKPLRVSLPTYPFARERYWIDTSAGPSAAAK